MYVFKLFCIDITFRYTIDVGVHGYNWSVDGLHFQVVLQQGSLQVLIINHIYFIWNVWLTKTCQPPVFKRCWRQIFMSLLFCFLAFSRHSKHFGYKKCDMTADFRIKHKIFLCKEYRENVVKIWILILSFLSSDLSYFTKLSFIRIYYA